MSALAGLDKVAWDKLETIEGSAAEAPVVLGWLASGDARKARKAVGWLFEEVLHQSTPAPSAAAFVPFLVELAALDKQPVRWQLVALLGDLACGGDHRPFIAGGDPASLDGKLHAAVARGHATYLAALADKDAKVRAAAAFALAWLPKQRARSLAALRARITGEAHATALASMHLAIAVLEGKADFAAARRAVTKLASSDALCWEHGDVQALAARITYPGAAAVDLDALIRTAVGTGPARELVAIIERLFPAKIEPRKLTDDQRSFLDALTRVPERFGLIQLVRLWSARGLPANARDARAKLGLEVQRRASPLDEPVTVDGKTQPFAAHLTAAVKAPAKRQALAAALAKAHAPAHVVDLCTRSLQLALYGQDKDGSLSRARVHAAIFEAFGDRIAPVLRRYTIPGELMGPEGDPFLTGAIALPMFHVLARLDAKPSAKRLAYLIQHIPLTVEVERTPNLPMVVEGLLALPPKLRTGLVEHLERNAFALDSADAKARFRQRVAPSEPTRAGRTR